jgi:hypothetical protein
MKSFSDSDYRRLTRELLVAALSRPRMWFTTIDHLEALMWGHEAAFGQLGVLHDQSFHAEFSSWMRKEFGVSVSAGWAYAITTLAKERGVDPEALLQQELPRFLREWAPSDEVP